jgi:O-antigen ligase
MRRFFYVCIASIGMLLASSPHARAQEPVYPKGLRGPSDIISGVFASNDAGSCCWVGTRAIVRTQAPTGADTLLLNVYLPDFAVRAGAQSLHVQIDGSPAVLRCCLGAGEHELTIPLPPVARGTAFTLTLWPGRTFVPKVLGLNEDTRHLSVMLRNVGFLNAATGERLDTAALAGMPARAVIPILLVCGAGIVLLTLRRPLYGLLALVLCDPFLVAYTTHGTAITLPKVALIAVALGLMPRAMRIVRARPLHTLYLLGGTQLLFAATMVPGFAHALSHGAVLRETLKALEYLMTMVVAYCAYRLDPGEKALRVAFAVLTIAVSAIAFTQSALSVGESELIFGHNLARIAGPLEGPNQLAGFLAVIVPAMVAFVILRKPMLVEWIAIAVGAMAALMTFSRGGIAALVLAVVVGVAIRYAPSRRAFVCYSVAAAFAAVLALAFGVFSGVLHGGVSSLFGASGEGTFNGGLGSRVDLWHGAYALWQSNPIFGVGAGNFELEVGRYFPGARTHANGIFFQVLAEQGIVGLIAAVAVTIASIAAFVRRLNEPLALGAFLAAIAMAFHQIVDCMWLFPKVAVMWWLLLASAAALVDQTAERP